MKRLLLTLGLLLGIASPAWAVDSYTSVGNANYSVLASDTRLAITSPLTANRTITLISAGGTNVGQGNGQNGPAGSSVLDIVDPFGNIGGANSCVVIAAQSGETINGLSSYTFCGTYGKLSLYPLSGSQWVLSVVSAGQMLGTTTNDNAGPGYVGEILATGICPGTGTTATVTITIAAPGVVTWTAHGLTGACPIQLTTSGALPTGLTASTTYWVVPSSITTNTFTLATSVANALAGTAITTTGTQSGTQTGTAGQPLSNTTAATITGLALTAGDWDCRSTTSRVLASNTSVTKLETAINATAATIGTQGGDAVTYFQIAATVLGALSEDQHIGPTRVSIAATTNYFLNVTDTFSVSSDAAFGSMACRRVR